MSFSISELSEEPQTSQVTAIPAPATPSAASPDAGTFSIKDLQEPETQSSGLTTPQQTDADKQPHGSVYNFLHGAYENTLKPIADLPGDLLKYYFVKAEEAGGTGTVKGNLNAVVHLASPSGDLDVMDKLRAHPKDPAQVLKDALKDPEHPIAKMVSGIVQAHAHTAAKVWEAQKASFVATKQAIDAARRGDWKAADAAAQQASAYQTETYGYGLATALPILGPAAANAGEDIGSGHVAEGLGKGTGLVAGVLAPHAISKASDALGKTVPRATEGVETAKPAATPVESAVSKAVAKSKLPEGQPATVAPTGEDIQPTLQQGIRDTMDRVAEENGVAKSTAKSVRDVVKETADNVYTKSKSQFAVLDEATGGNVSRFDEQLRNVNRALANVTDDAEEAKLLSRKATLEANQEEAFEQARAKGVDPTLVDEAKANYRRAQALYDVDNHIKMSTSGNRPNIGKPGAQTPEMVDPKKLSSRLNKVYDSGRLQDAVGEENAQELLTHADKAQIAGQQIKDFAPSSATGQKAMQEILRPNTKGKLIGSGANTDFLKSYRDFDALTPEEQTARFGKDVEQARSYLKTQARNQLISKWGVRAGLGYIAYKTGLAKELLHAIWD